MNNLNANIKKFVTYVIVLSPLFLQYIIFFDFILLPEYFLILGVFLVLGKGWHINIKYHYFMLQYLLYIFLGILFFAAYSEEFNIILGVTTYARFLFYVFFVAITYRRFFDISLAIKILYFVAFFNSMYGLIQYVAYTKFSIVLPWSLPFLTVHYGALLINEQDYFFREFGYRFSGLFSEPAHFSQYVGIALIFAVFFQGSGQINSPALRLAVISVFLLSLLLSGSGTASFVIILMSLIFSMRIYKNKTGSGIFVARLVAVFLVISIITLAANFGADLNSGFERMLNISDNSSAYVRVLRPFEIYTNLSILGKIFGIGYGNYAEYVLFNGLMNVYEASRDVIWTNAAGVILVGGGGIALILFSLHFLYLYLKSKSFSRILIIYFFAHIFFSDLPLTIFYIVIMSFVFATIGGKNDRPDPCAKRVAA